MSDNHRTSRRTALKVPAALAAAFALPLGTPKATEAAEALLELAANPAPPACHPLLCFHDKYRNPEDSKEYGEIYDALRATLNAEQRELLFKLDSASGNDWIVEQDRFVDELVRHFPGLAPAIRAVAWHHLNDQLPADAGACCEGDGEMLAGSQGRLR
jgi:hypothetical protein